MNKRQIGNYNNNWKGGHRRDEPESIRLSDRQILEVNIHTCESILCGLEGYQELAPDLFTRVNAELEQYRTAQVIFDKLMITLDLPVLDPEQPFESEFITLLEMQTAQAVISGIREKMYKIN